MGVRTVEDRARDGQTGFPVSVTLADGSVIVLELPSPAFLASLDPEGIGVAILDPLGYTRTAWGLARRIPHFRSGQSVLDSPLGGLLRGSYEGNHGALYLDGVRYFSSGMPAGNGTDVFVLVVNSNEEKQARKQASKSWRTANALKRLGNALTMNQNMQPLCVAAVHEIASATELAAVLLWTHNQEEGTLELAACVGANRTGTNALSRLSTRNMAGCAAELVATSLQPFSLTNVVDHVLTANLEAKFCYLKPGGLSVHPLIISDKLLGVLELVGREGDPYFIENDDLFQTIAEHLALALNSASMFENFELLASKDALTGLANHRSMQEFLHQRLTESERTGQEMGLIMLDVDHFRSFNEEEGHDAGDEVLKLVADALKSCMRPYDMAARYGGEEFTVIMPGSGRTGVMAAAERIRQKVESAPYVTRSGRVAHVTVSLGCAVYPATAKEPSTLLKAADVAMYEAKRTGRNRTVFSEGSYESAPRPEGISMDSLKEWIHPLDWEEGERRLERMASMIECLTNALRLSRSQQLILEALLRVVTTYRRAVQNEDQQYLEAIEGASEFRLLLPSLQRLGDRFDGVGDQQVGGLKIPLLARILEVLLALDEDKGQPLITDPGRFDPEIVSKIIDHERAA